MFMFVVQNSPYSTFLPSVIPLSHFDANSDSELFPSAVGPQVRAGQLKSALGSDSLTFIHTRSDSTLFPPDSIPGQVIKITQIQT